MTEDAARTSGRGRGRLARNLLGAILGAAALAAAVVGGVRLAQEVDELETQLARAEDDLTDVQSDLHELESAVGSGLENAAEMDGLMENVGAVEGVQQSLAAAVASLSDELDAVRSEAERMSEFLDSDSLFASTRVDLQVLEGCMAWIVDQIGQMANGFAPDYLPPNDCRLLR